MRFSDFPNNFYSLDWLLENFKDLGDIYDDKNPPNYYNQIFKR